MMKPLSRIQFWRQNDNGNDLNQTDILATMNIKIRVPLSLHKLTGNKTELECQGDTVEQLLANLNNQFPGIIEILYDEEGRIRPSFNVFVNGKSVRFLKNEKIFLKDGDEVLLMQLVAGG